jgi:hypothetical protein
MPKVSGSVTLWFEDVEFDDGELCLQDLAIEALQDEAFGRGEIIEVKIDTIDGVSADA